MSATQSDLLQRFEAADLEPGAFGHREHLQVAFEMLQSFDFMEVCTRYTRAIRRIANDAGVPEKFNLTITLAFLSLVAERLAAMPDTPGFDEFLAENGDLLSKDALQTWYTDAQLKSDFARTHFMLPRRFA